MLYKITNKMIHSTNKVRFSDANIYERDIENWVEMKPDILGEPLKIIGRQVTIENIGDRLDLLSLDKQGNLVIIELKSDILKSSACLQAVQYASYLSDWQHEEINRQMKNYTKNKIDFIDVIENFCEDDYEINDRQRIILAGREIRPRTSSVAIWLRKQGVDIKVVQLEPWQDEDVIYINPKVLIPVPVEEQYQIKAYSENKSRPWKENGKKWHLDNRCSEQSAELLNSVIVMIKKEWPDIEGPNWNQKSYVSFKIAGSNWIYIRTHAGNLRMQVRCFLDEFDTKIIAESLNIIPLDDDHVNFQGNNENQVKKWSENNRLVFRLNTNFDLDKKFLEVLKELKKSFEEKILK
ncbi:MAG: hypothetical protein ACOCRK_08610 [bacterium]